MGRFIFRSINWRSARDKDEMVVNLIKNMLVVGFACVDQ
jgi:hypothetical protein